MATLSKVRAEVLKIGLISLYFFCWFALLLLIKKLLLAEYHIRAGGVAIIIIGALTVAKVVALLEHVSLGAWVRRRPVVVDVALRSLVYLIGVAVFMLLEKAFEARHEYGGFGRAAAGVFQHREIDQVWLAVVSVGVALLFYNVFTALRRRFGAHAMAKLFLSVTPAELDAASPEHAHGRTGE